MSHAVLTGPIKGSVTLDDGTEIDVSPALITVETPEQAAEVAEKVGQRYATEGHPNVPEGFVHTSKKG